MLRQRTQSAGSSILAREPKSPSVNWLRPFARWPERVARLFRTTVAFVRQAARLNAYAQIIALRENCWAGLRKSHCERACSGRWSGCAQISAYIELGYTQSKPPLKRIVG